MIDRYIKHMNRKHRSPGTIRLRLFYLHKFQSWHGDLTTAEHDDFEAYLSANRHWSPNTQAAASASLKTFYRWAHREGLLTENPARDLPNIDAHRRTPRTASETAIRDGIEGASLQDQAMILLGAECGLRVSEIATLHKSDRDGEWLRIVGKGNYLRTLHMSPELCAILDQIEATEMRHGWYFPGRSGIRPIHSSTAWRHITRLINCNPHSLRRRAGTVVYRQSGHDIRLAQQFLGHKSTATTEIYLDVAQDDLIHASQLTRVAA